MAEPAQRCTAGSRSWWVRLCHWLWRGLTFLWIAIIVGLVINIASTRLTSAKDFPPDSPVGWILLHLLIIAPPGLLLLGLTAFVGVVSQRNALRKTQPISILPTPSEQNRMSMLRNLRQEYNRRLTSSLQGVAMMVLGLHERTDITISSAQLVFRRSQTKEERELPFGTSIVQVYDEAGQGLLILGEPGAGKTTLLLDLARELLLRAESDTNQPMPVILNLSNWANKQLPLATWLVDQLQLAYGVPSSFGQTWLKQNQLLLLLDGLDEVEESSRAACIETINAYRSEYFVPLVVCSRSHEYLDQQARLILPCAVVVQPLQEYMVTEYLKRLGKPMAAVRSAIRTNPILQKLITTPLMLNVIILTYRDKSVKDLPRLGSVEEQQQQTFERYVQRMLEQRVNKGAFTPDQMRHWLSWLARQMQERHLTEFYLEHLQPSWLASKREQIIYKMLGGLIFGLLGWQIFELFGLNFVSYILGKLDWLAFGQRLGEVDWQLSGLFFGLLFGLLFGPGSKGIHPTEVLVWSWKRFLKGPLLGLAFGSLIGLLDMLIILLFGRGIGTVLGWLIFRQFNWWVAGLLDWQLNGLIIGLGVGLYLGLSGKRITEQLRIRPNLGIRNSAWNALRIGLMSALFFVLADWLVHDLSITLTDVDYLLSYVLLRLLIGGLFVGLIAGLIKGGAAYFEHYILRFLLWQNRALPWQYVRFLEEMSACILLQRVGGGYRFIHPLFLDYFASYSTKKTPLLTGKSHLQQP